MTAILRDSTAVVVVRTRPQAIPLAMIAMRKSTHGFPLVFYMCMGLHLATLRAPGAPLRKNEQQQQQQQRLKQIQDHLNFWKIQYGNESVVIILIDSGSGISSIVKHFYFFLKTLNGVANTRRKDL